MPTEMLREIEQRTREARLHGKKIGSGNRFVRLPQPPGQYIDEIAVDLGVLCHALLECIAAHEAQLAITNGEYRGRSRPAVEESKLARDRTRTKDREYAVVAARGGDHDLEQALLQTVAAVAESPIMNSASPALR